MSVHVSLRQYAVDCSEAVAALKLELQRADNRIDSANAAHSETDKALMPLQDAIAANLVTMQSELAVTAAQAQEFCKR